MNEKDQIKDLFYYFKSICTNMDNVNLNDLNDKLNNFKLFLSNIEFNDTFIEYEINKLIKVMSNNNIFNMKHKDIPTYLGKILSIIEFIVY